VAEGAPQAGIERVIFACFGNEAAAAYRSEIARIAPCG